MTIAEVREKCKKLPRDILILGILITASLLSFSLGYMAGLEQGNGAGELSPTAPTTTTATTSIVASRNGTKYYLPGCTGSERISVVNRIYFGTVSAAEIAGYTKAENCSAK